MSSCGRDLSPQKPADEKAAKSAGNNVGNNARAFAVRFNAHWTCVLVLHNDFLSVPPGSCAETHRSPPARAPHIVFIVHRATRPRPFTRRRDVGGGGWTCCLLPPAANRECGRMIAHYLSPKLPSVYIQHSAIIPAVIMVHHNPYGPHLGAALTARRRPRPPHRDHRRRRYRRRRAPPLAARRAARSPPSAPPRTDPPPQSPPPRTRHRSTR